MGSWFSSDPEPSPINKPYMQNLQQQRAHLKNPPIATTLSDRNKAEKNRREKVAKEEAEHAEMVQRLEAAKKYGGGKRRSTRRSKKRCGTKRQVR